MLHRLLYVYESSFPLFEARKQRRVFWFAVVILFENIEWLCELKTFKARGQQIEREFQLNINLRLK